MNHRVSSIRNLRTIKALRADPLKIDLGVTLNGQLKAWMKKDPNDKTFREFEILDNRYLTLSKEKTSDYYLNGEIVEEVAGKWYFDVELLDVGQPATKTRTIYTGTIFFVNDITGSVGEELVLLSELFNIEGGNSQTIYLNNQIMNLGDSNT